MDEPQVPVDVSNRYLRLIYRFHPSQKYQYEDEPVPSISTSSSSYWYFWGRSLACFLVVSDAMKLVYHETFPKATIAPKPTIPGMVHQGVDCSVQLNLCHIATGFLTLFILLFPLARTGTYTSEQLLACCYLSSSLYFVEVPQCLKYILKCCMQSQIEI